MDKVSRFVFEILVDETVYEYAFAVTKREVREERLVRVNSRRERVLFERQRSTITFDGHKDRDFWSFAFRGTDQNQLFLTNAVSQKVEAFRPIYQWFERLQLISPQARYEPIERFFESSRPLSTAVNQMLSNLDTGIERLSGEEMRWDALPEGEALKELLSEVAPQEKSIRVGLNSTDDRIVVSNESGNLKLQKLVSFHSKVGGGEVKFELRNESDGSKRVIDLLPAFLDLSSSQSSGVYIIDELDRSLHTLLTRRLLESYLASCSKDNRTQLLFTTHDLLLMDQDLLRRDEMWVAERDHQGVSKLISLAEYREIRKDKDIRKSYLQGRLGGIPRILGELLLDD